MTNEKIAHYIGYAVVYGLPFLIGAGAMALGIHQGIKSEALSCSKLLLKEGIHFDELMKK